MSKITLAYTLLHRRQALYIDGGLAVECEGTCISATLNALGIEFDDIPLGKFPPNLEVPRVLGGCRVEWDGYTLTVYVTTEVLYGLQHRLSKQGATWQRILTGSMTVGTGDLSERADLLGEAVAKKLREYARSETVVRACPDLDEVVAQFRRNAHGGPAAHKTALRGWPDEWTDRHHNGIKVPCDMLVGPCVCGAWHHAEEDWVQLALAAHGVTIEDV